MKKKKTPIVLLLVFIFLIALVGFGIILEIGIMPKNLSEIQTIACNTADKAGTCDSRLVEVGIVLKEDCCQALGKCC